MKKATTDLSRDVLRELGHETCMHFSNGGATNIACTATDEGKRCRKDADWSVCRHPVHYVCDEHLVKAALLAAKARISLTA